VLYCRPYVFRSLTLAADTFDAAPYGDFRWHEQQADVVRDISHSLAVAPLVNMTDHWHVSASTHFSWHHHVGQVSRFSWHSAQPTSEDETATYGVARRLWSAAFAYYLNDLVAAYPYSPS
jgi:hypothetical protein